MRVRAVPGGQGDDEHDVHGTGARNWRCPGGRWMAGASTGRRRGRERVRGDGGVRGHPRARDGVHADHGRVELSGRGLVRGVWCTIWPGKNTGVIRVVRNA